MVWSGQHFFYTSSFQLSCAVYVTHTPLCIDRDLKQHALVNLTLTADVKDTVGIEPDTTRPNG
jgi:hypothetical protein